MDNPRQERKKSCTPLFSPEDFEQAKALGKHGILKQAKDVVIPCQLECFKEGAHFKIPGLVRRSTTADIVKTGNSTPDQQRAMFIELRRTSFEAYRLWTGALVKYNFAHNPMSRALPEAMTKESKGLQLASQQHMQSLLKMAKNGIWNCAEFAHFALLQINESEMLKEGYTAQITSLNDPKIPEEGAAYYKQFQLILSKQKVHEGENHDHVFVVIKDKGQNPVFVIDLWQMLAANEPYIGTFKNFISFLNKKVDRQFVKKEVNETDFLSRSYS